MIERDKLIAYTDTLLQAAEFKDYAPNGLQVAGKRDIRKIVSGVTADIGLIDHAVAVGADLILVHHGYFWRNESPCVIGIKRERLRLLLEHEINLLAYHLPLDAHASLGNNAQLARLLGLEVDGSFGPVGEIPLALTGYLPTPLSPDALADLLLQKLGRRPLHLSGAAAEIRRVGWCTGAAQGYLELAAGQGLDAYISGEVSEHCYYVAAEAGIHFYAAGHHATERYGVQALGAHLARHFGLGHEFYDSGNPV